MLLLFEDSGTTYLLRDEFAVDAAAPLASPRQGEVGTLTITDTGNRVSISGGKLIMAGAGGANDPLVASASYARVAGRVVLFGWNVSDRGSDRFRAGWSASAGYPNLFSSLIVTSNVWQIDGVNMITGPQVDTDYELAQVQRISGYYMFVKISGIWTLIWPSSGDTTTPLYAVAGARAAAAFTFRSTHLRVRDLPAPFATDALATINVTSATQSLGSELLTNGDFGAWTADNPNGWTVSGESGSDPMVTQVDPSGSAGTGAARVYSSATSSQPRISQSVMSSGNIYEMSIEVKVATLGGLAIIDGAGGAALYGLVTTGIKKMLTRQTGAAYRVHGGTAPVDAVIDNASTKQLTPNAAQTVDASSILDATFALPASPVAGDQYHLCYRISAAGEEFLNDWESYLLRNDANNAWDFKVDSVASGTHTNRTTTAGVGNVTTLRAIPNGNNHDHYTLVGTTWTKRGSTITSALYNTATLVNTIYTSGFTFVSLVAYPVTSSNYNALNNV